MPEGGLEITRVYIEHGKAEVEVRYVDNDGNVLYEDDLGGTLYIGDDYDVSKAKDITTITKDGKIYDFTDDGGAVYTGAVTEDGVVITRVYKERAKATVVVKYVDSDGNVLREITVSEDTYVGADYDVSQAKEIGSIEKDGKIYDFTNDGDAKYIGKMPEGGLVITRVYKARETSAPDDDTGEIIPDDTKPEGDKPEGDTGDDIVSTGDKGIGVWLIGCAVSVIAILVLLIIRKRRYGF